MSEPPMPSEPRLSSSVATTMPMYSPSPPSLYPPYSAGTLRPNAPISARPVMISSGTSSLCAVHVLGVRLDDLLGERAERVGHHLELVVEVAGAGRLGQRGHELGGAELLEERMGSAQRRELEPHSCLAAGDSG